MSRPASSATGTARPAPETPPARRVAPPGRRVKLCSPPGYSLLRQASNVVALPVRSKKIGFVKATTGMPG